MAGIPSGALAPSSSPTTSDPWSEPLAPVAACTRKRRNHGVFTFGAGVASVYSSRRAADAGSEAVSMVLMDGTRTVSGGLSSVQARAMARALLAAAAAFDDLRVGGVA